jgi:HSP20 family protein
LEEERMRYRRMSYRYAVVLNASQPRPFGDTLRADQLVVRLAQTCWRPAADVYETADALVVTVDLAGIDPEAVEATLFEDAVIVEGQRRLPTIDGAGFYHAAEIRQGRFRLELALPTVIDGERVEARYERGLLLLVIPKADVR